MIAVRMSSKKEVCGGPPLVSPPQSRSSSHEARREGDLQVQEQDRRQEMGDHVLRREARSGRDLPRRRRPRSGLGGGEGGLGLANVAVGTDSAEERESERELLVGLRPAAGGRERRSRE